MLDVETIRSSTLITILGFSAGSFLDINPNPLLQLIICV